MTSVSSPKEPYLIVFDSRNSGIKGPAQSCIDNLDIMVCSPSSDPLHCRTYAVWGRTAGQSSTLAALRQHRSQRERLPTGDELDALSQKERANKTKEFYRVLAANSHLIPSLAGLIIKTQRAELFEANPPKNFQNTSLGKRERD